jgi:plasmid stabilization system protein ParE
MKITFLEQAKLEFLDAISYYESEQPGLGQRFKDELDRSLRWLLERPEVCRLRSGGYRRINLRIFPFYIPYVVREATLWVLAIAHNRRRPEYWIKRHPDIR